jgi:hypothetical protein
MPVCCSALSAMQPAQPVDIGRGSFVRLRPRPCQNSNARRARRSILEKFHVMRTDNAADIRLDAILENCIFYIFRMYEFSHSLDPERTSACCIRIVTACPPRVSRHALLSRCHLEIIRHNPRISIPLNADKAQPHILFVNRSTFISLISLLKIRP